MRYGDAIIRKILDEEEVIPSQLEAKDIVCQSDIESINLLGRNSYTNGKKYTGNSNEKRNGRKTKKSTVKKSNVKYGNAKEIPAKKVKLKTKKKSKSNKKGGKK
jgi:hypothetical protein